MPVTTIPFVGSFNRRFGGASTVDQQYTNGVFTEAPNSATESNNIYFEKRNGISAAQTPAAGSNGNGMFFSPSTGIQISVFANAGTYTIYDLVTSVGTSSTNILHISEAILNGLTFILFTSYSEAFFYQFNALASLVGDTHSNTTIDNIIGGVSPYVGQLITGTGIPVGTRVASIVSGNSITITQAATATNAGVAFTLQKLAKIIDADFPTDLTGPFCEMDGYLFMGTQSGKIYNSDINSVTSWRANNFIQANIYTDPGIGAFKYKNKIGFFGTNSLEFFYNAGNSSGSPLSRDASSALKVGCSGGGAGQLAASFDVNQDYIAWTDPNVNLYIYKDGELKKVSNPGIFLGGGTDRTVTVFNYRTLRLISIYAGSGSGGRTYWYSIDYDLFVDLGITLGQMFISSNNYAAGLAVTYLTISAGTAGKTYTLGSNNVYQDNSAAFTMTIQTEPYYLNKGLPFVIDNITLLADTQSSGSTLLESTANDYASFGTIGSFSLTDQQKNLAGGGYYDSSVAFRLTDSGNNPWRGQALQITWRPCL